MKLMILGDSPTKTTGFARVVRNLMEHWLMADAFEEIHVWAVGYWGYPHGYDNRRVKLYPAAGPRDERWESAENLKRFAAVLETCDFTHLWMLQDVWGLMPLSILVRRLAREKGLKTLLYFPVDAPLDRNWTEIIASVSVPVAYCHYGMEEAAKALLLPTGEKKIDRLRSQAVERLCVLPHGVDHCFFPMIDEVRHKARSSLTKGVAKPEDHLIVNVSAHQRRKGLVQTLQLHAALRGGADRYLFYLHCEPINHGEGSSLYMIAEQLGTAGEIGRTLFFADKSYFPNGQPALNDSGLNTIYNCADLLLSTSLGEGWGLPLTEAMAARTPVAAPDHTSCAELLGQGRGLLLPVSTNLDMLIGDNSRLRPRVRVDGAAIMIPGWLNGGHVEQSVDRAQAWVSRPEMQWETIAKQWLGLMET